MSALEQSFRANGWYISTEGLSKLMENGGPKDPKNLMRKALDIDLREIGAPIINTELTKNYFGPVVLQITKIKNIAAPKVKQNSQGAPRMLKLSLTDGQNNLQAIEVKGINSLNLDNTPPGTKIFINGAQISSGCLLLNPKNCVILGGNVPALVERWEISKSMPSHNRVSDEGPPPWVNFGKRIITQKLPQNQNFKSLNKDPKAKDGEKDSDFQNQRQEMISEVAQGAIKKVFGGGTKVPQSFSEPQNNYHYRNNYNQNNSTNNQNTAPINSNNNTAPQRGPPKRGKVREKVEKDDKIEKPSQRVSLFDFLEDKLPVSETPKVDKPQNYAQTRQDYAPKGPRKTFNKPNFENQNYERRDYNHSKTDQPPRNQNSKYPNRYNDKPEPRELRNFNKNYEKPEFQPPNPKYQPQERPPRFQKNQQQSVSNKSYPKPDTNNFVDKLANEVNNISLYNSKFENQKGTYRWKIGDRCMAKYWEDNKFYNAVVTGITNKTCMVEFLEYGNFEEVLHCDCIPVTSEPEPPSQPQKNQFPNNNRNFNENQQQFSGNLEFRRKTRPFVKNQNRSYQN